MNINESKIPYERKEFKNVPLRAEDLHKEPMQQFLIWYAEAQKNENEDASAFVLSTCSKNLQPTSRVVLLRDIKDSCFIFFTNYLSRKGKDIDENPQVSMLFYWSWLERQVRIEGIASQTDPSVSDAYFQSRPRLSKIAAMLSQQSEPIPPEVDLIEMADFAMHTMCEADLIRPKHWGGYKVAPLTFEFWQGRTGRLHDRYKYYSENEQWKIIKLFP